MSMPALAKDSLSMGMSRCWMELLATCIMVKVNFFPSFSRIPSPSASCQPA